MKKQADFTIRGFVSLLLSFCFLFLAISGIFLFVAPPCRVADEISWKVLGIAKEQWLSAHMTFALIFLIMAVIHLLVYNYRIFFGYMNSGKSRFLSMRPALLYALMLAVIIFAGAVLMLPPFNLLPGAHEAIQGHYRDQPGIDERDNRREGRGQGRETDNDEIPRQPHSDGIILMPIGLQVLGTSDLSISADLSGGAFEASFQ